MFSSEQQMTNFVKIFEAQHLFDKSLLHPINCSEVVRGMKMLHHMWKVARYRNSFK